MNGKTPDILIPAEYASILTGTYREAIVEGGRNSLKSHTIARIILIWTMQEKTRVLCGREFQNSISESVHQLLADLISYYNLNQFKVTKDSIFNEDNGSDFIFKGVRHNTQSIKSLEGVDIFWGEESQTFSKNSIDIITPTIRKPGSRLIWTLNRLNELDPIYERLVVNKMPNTIHIHANYDVAEKYGYLSDDVKAEIEHDKINNPELYNHKWLGQPISQTDNAIINRTDALEAMNRQVGDDGAVEVGVDVARYGNDRSSFYKRKGLVIKDYKEFSKLSLTDLANNLESFVDFDKSIRIKIDDTGVGSGLTDIMKERGYNIIPINFGSTPNNKDRYTNLISEAWFYLQSIMKDIQLPMDSDLLMELTTRKWKLDSKGRRGVESKDDYKKRGYRSPDKADGLILCFYTPEVKQTEWLTADDMWDDD